jgi:hypothetical protein
MTAHDAERQLMVPGGQFMAENDKPWDIFAGFETNF